MTMVWQDWTSLNKKYNDAWLAGLGAGVLDTRSSSIGVGLTEAEDLANIIWWGQVWTNEQLAAWNVEPIASDGVMTAEFCGALKYVVDMAMAGNALLPEFQAWATTYGGEIEPLCLSLAKPPPLLASGQPATVPTAPVPAPAPTPAPAPVVIAPTTPAPAPSGGGLTPVEGTACYVHNDTGETTCDCYIYEGDAGPHIAHYQQALNVALEAGGYVPIMVSGVWDKETCGAVFTLYGSFQYDPTTNPYCPYGSDFIFPVECPGMVIPTKLENKKSRASMMAIGGLVLAAVLGGAYYVSQR